MAGRGPKIGEWAYAHSPIFGYSLSFREVLILGCYPANAECGIIDANHSSANKELTKHAFLSILWMHLLKKKGVVGLPHTSLY
jgi:hypothetical protein